MFYYDTVYTTQSEVSFSITLCIKYTKWNKNVSLHKILSQRLASFASYLKFWKDNENEQMSFNFRNKTNTHNPITSEFECQLLILNNLYLTSWARSPSLGNDRELFIRATSVLQWTFRFGRHWCLNQVTLKKKVNKIHYNYNINSLIALLF